MIKAERSSETVQAFGILRQLARKPSRRTEQCEFCSVELRADHSHLIESTQRKLLCSCDACTFLFSGRSDLRYKRVPREVRLLANFHMSDAEWDGLLIPINLAFFLQNSLDSRVSALYPSPAGATESLLSLSAWATIGEANPVLRRLAPDVEALLVNRVGNARGAEASQYYIVPIDACYKLVGLIRIHWRGLGGGTEVWQQIGNFFAELRAKAEVMTEGIDA